MFSSRQLCSPCSVSCPAPVTDTRSRPCVTSCGDSRVVIYPPPVLVTFPGPILSSCPQESVVGSSAVAASPGWGGFYGSRTSLGYGAAQGREFSSSSRSQRVRGCGFRSQEPSQSQQESPCSKSAPEAECEVQTQD